MGTQPLKMNIAWSWLRKFASHFPFIRFHTFTNDLQEKEGWAHHQLV